MPTTKMPIMFENAVNHTPTVRELIAELQKCKNQDAPVTVYLLDGDGDGNHCTYSETGRYPICGVDDAFENHRRVDINIIGLIQDKKS